MRFWLIKYFSFPILLFLSVSYSWAGMVLPDPTGFIDGTPYPNAMRYDDFYSYSAEMMADYYGVTRLASNQGSGLEDELKLWWSNSEYDKQVNIGSNLGLGDGSFDFEDPLQFPNAGNTDSFNTDLSLSWMTSVDNLYSYLLYLDSSIPLFVFDNNQANNVSSQLVNGYVSIVDEDGNVAFDIVRNKDAIWSFDNSTNGVFDIDELVDVPLTMDGIDGKTLYNTSGTSSADYYVYSSTMDLSQFLDGKYYFKVAFQFQNLSDGFEDVFITGLQVPKAVPEPSSIFLMGLGVTVLAFFRRCSK